MSNRFQAFANSDREVNGVNDNGDVEDDSQDEDGEEGKFHGGFIPARPPSPFAQLFGEAYRLLFRPYPEMLGAVAVYDSIERKCVAGDDYSLIKCASYTGDAYRQATHGTLRNEEYDLTLTYFDSSIQQHTRAMHLCDQLSIRQEAEGAATSSSMDAEQIRSGDRVSEAISIALDDVFQLRNSLRRHRANIEVQLQRSEEERDVVKASIGPTKWKSLKGNSSWAETREKWRKQLRDIDAVLERIEASERERDMMRAFEEAQKVKAQRLKLRMEARKEAARLAKGARRGRGGGRGRGDGFAGGRGDRGGRGRGRGIYVPRGTSSARGGSEGEGDAGGAGSTNSSSLGAAT